MKKAVILLPTYNEKDNLEKFIEDVFKEEKNSSGWHFEILVVDSSSPDGTMELAQKLAAKNSRLHTLTVGKGLGVALIEGHNFAIKNLKPDGLVQMDADGQVGTDVLPRLLKGLDEGCDLVLGSRFVSGGKNKLSFSRRLFSAGSSWVCRILMGPFDIREFTNSARAFTPALFQKINFGRLPWREKSFIIQPAFLHEAILAGAKYKEVPLVFKNRAEGYSKNKVVNYTYDLITYALDARLHQWGINIPLFAFTRRVKTLIKFGVVGFSGTIVDFAFYNIFISVINIPPATSKAFSTEIAIINNFIFNHIWTFRYRKNQTKLWQKFTIFNLVSLGGLLIGVLIIKLLHTLYGNGFVDFLGIKVAYYNIYFFITIPPVMLWNFTVNHLVTWKHQKD